MSSWLPLRDPKSYNRGGSLSSQAPPADSLNKDLAAQVAESIGSDATALQPFMIELTNNLIMADKTAQAAVLDAWIQSYRGGEAIPVKSASIRAGASAPISMVDGDCESEDDSHLFPQQQPEPVVETSKE